jgi:hypothetical protein
MSMTDWDSAANARAQLSPGKETTRIPTLAVDFDGCIHSYISGWLGATNIPDPPVPHAREALALLGHFFQVVIFSTRAETEEGCAAIAAYMALHQIPYSGKITAMKPSAVLIIDDRAITFRGDWGRTLAETLMFRHYMEKDRE